jgi:hypothetical protein
MILETFLIKNMKVIENFDENTDKVKNIAGGFIAVLVIALVLIIFYVGGAVSLSLNYNNYIGTSGGLKILYIILVFFFPTLYYPFYAWFLSPALGVKNRSPTNRSSSITGGPRI